MKDIFGIEIEEGDRIAFNPPFYKGLTLGFVIGFTPHRGSHRSKDTTTAYPLDIAIDMTKRMANNKETENIEK